MACKFYTDILTDNGFVCQVLMEHTRILQTEFLRVILRVCPGRQMDKIQQGLLR